MTSRAATAVLAELRRRGWTQNALARRIGVRSGTLSRWLAGRMPPLDAAAAIERELGVRPELWLKKAS